MAPTVYMSELTTSEDGPPRRYSGPGRQRERWGDQSSAPTVSAALAITAASAATSASAYALSAQRRVSSANNAQQARRRAARVIRQTRGQRERRMRGSLWLQSPLGYVSEDTRQSMLREEEPRISTNSINSSIDSSNANTNSSNSSISSSHSSDTPSPSPSSSPSSSPLDSSSVPSNKDADSALPLLASETALDQRLLLLRKRDGLLDITIRTMKLMRRNQQLQQRLTVLQAETRAFVRSVMSNPENQGLRLNSASMILDKRQDDSESKESTDSDMQDQNQDSAVSVSGDSAPEK